MRNDGIRVVIKSPKRRAVDVFLPAALVKKIKSEVGKSIAVLNMDSRYLLLYTRGGKEKGLEYCMRMAGIDLHGDVILIGKRGNCWKDAPVTAAECDGIIF